MAQATNLSTTSRFHNLSPVQLADAIGQADAVLKGAEAESKALKEEFKARGLLTAAGEHSPSLRLTKSPAGSTSPPSRPSSATGGGDLRPQRSLP
jgi:hypothetical protein